MPRTDPPSRTEPGADDLLTASEVAGRARVAVRTVYGWIGSGDLKATKLGRNYRVTEDAWVEFLASHTPAVTPPASPVVAEEAS